MGFPKLKYPRLCRMTPYVVVLGCGLLPIFVIAAIPAPEIVKFLVIMGCLVGLLAYILRNFMVLMAMDMALASLSCHRTARTQYTLPDRRSADQIRRSILRYGTPCDPASIEPKPSALRYKFSRPMTVYASGIERIVAAYEVDMLTPDTYGNLLRSAKANSKALIGKKKAVFLEKDLKKQPLHRVTVLLILAHKVDPQMIPDLYKLVCRHCGDEQENCLVPCVVDLERRSCVFNCLRLPYVGLGYPVKNRGIRIVRQRVLGGSWNLRGNSHFLEPMREIHPESSVWDFWRDLHHTYIGADRETKRRFASMAVGEIAVEKDLLYLKWDQRGICQAVESDGDSMTVTVEAITNWYYPKRQPIGQKTIRKMEAQITAYYRAQGYSVQFADAETVR